MGTTGLVMLEPESLSNRVCVWGPVCGVQATKGVAGVNREKAVRHVVRQAWGGHGVGVRKCGSVWCVVGVLCGGQAARGVRLACGACGCAQARGACGVAVCACGVAARRVRACARVAACGGSAAAVRVVVRVCVRV